MNTGGQEFDEQALNEQMGISPTTTLLTDQDPSEVNLHPNDRQAMDQIAGRQPAGIQPPAGSPAGVREYLAGHMPPPASPPSEPPAPKDWAAEYQKAFGQPPAEGESVTRESFERDVLRHNAYVHSLNQHADLSDLRAITAPNAKPLELIQAEVRRNLENVDLYTDELFDAQMKKYVGEDGQLNTAGQTRYERMKTEAAGRINVIEQQAQQAADKAEQDQVGFYNTLGTQLKAFSFYGIPLDEKTQADILEDIQSGEVDNWLDHHSDTNQAVQKAILLALVHKPERLADVVRQLDNRGYEYGRNTRLAAQI